MLQAKYSKEEIARRGEELYETHTRRSVEKEFDGKIIALDIESGDYEIDETTLPAADRLRVRHPDAELYVMRIGYDTVYSFHGLLPRRGQL